MHVPFNISNMKAKGVYTSYVHGGKMFSSYIAAATMKDAKAIADATESEGPKQNPVRPQFIAAGFFLKTFFAY